MLVKEWKKCHKLWSLRLGALGTIVTGALVSFPDFAVQAWAFMPTDIRDTIAPQYAPMIGVAIFVTSMIARLVQQNKLTEEVKRMHNEI